MMPRGSSPYAAFALAENTKAFLPIFKQALLRRGEPMRVQPASRDSRGGRVSSGISSSRRGCRKKNVASSANLRKRPWREIAQKAGERLAAVRLYLAGE